MRIIAGSRRGVKLWTPRGMAIRPTPDMVRESLFNILGQEMKGTRFMDLYAGTGAVGLEAVSRGAERCVLVDSSREAVQLCRRNTERLRFAGSVEILQMDAGGAVRYLAARGDRFEVIFAGPPFREPVKQIGRLAGEIGRLGLLCEGGIFVVQLPAGSSVPQVEGLKLLCERRYGRNKLVFFTKNGGQEGEESRGGEEEEERETTL